MKRQNKNKKLKNLLILANEWFSKAKDDELSAMDILKDREGAASTVCFLSQQMAEKYFKGYLVFKNQEFPKIHDLNKLVNLCKKLDDNFEKVKSAAQFLSKFYISTRYPGDYPEYNFKDAKKAFEKAVKIKIFVLGKIKS